MENPWYNPRWRGVSVKEMFGWNGLKQVILGIRASRPIVKEAKPKVSPKRRGRRSSEGGLPRKDTFLVINVFDCMLCKFSLVFSLLKFFLCVQVGFICRTCDVVFRECLRTERFRGDGGRGSPAARVEKQEPRWCSCNLL